MKLLSKVISTIEKSSGVSDIERTLFFSTLRGIQKVDPKRAAELALSRFAQPKRWDPPPFEVELAKRGSQIEFRCGLFGYRFGSGKPVMLIHGWGGRGLQMGAVIDPLVQKGYSVFAVDGPAHGLSPGSETSPSHFAVFIKSVGNEIGPLEAVVAHSFGAGATVLALTYNLKAKKAVLVACPNKYDQILIRYCEQIGLNAEATHEFIKLISYKVGIPGKDFHLSKFLSEVSQPTLIFHDKNDKELSYHHGEELALSNSKVGLILTEGLGHRRILKSPEFVEKAVQFISED